MAILGFVCLVISLIWVAHLILYVLVQPPITPVRALRTTPLARMPRATHTGRCVVGCSPPCLLLHSFSTTFS